MSKRKATHVFVVICHDPGKSDQDTIENEYTVRGVFPTADLASQEVERLKIDAHGKRDFRFAYQVSRWRAHPLPGMIDGLQIHEQE